MIKSAFYFLFVFLIVITSSKVFGKSGNFLINEDEKVTVVVIDPGHGGIDFGASAGDLYEKDIALSVSLKLGEKIKTAFPDIKLIYTRTSDVFIPLYERAEIANLNKADLFISIHVNSVEQTYVKGAETYVLGQYLSEENLEVAKIENSVILLEDNYNITYEGFDPKSPESYIMFELVQDEYLELSVLFASTIQNQFREFANRSDRSVRQAGFWVLRQTTMPSVLVEVGFISNPDDREFICNESGQNTLSDAIFNAFTTYKKRVEDKSRFSLNVEKENSNKDKTDIESETAANEYEKNNNENIYFSIQISASIRKLKPTSVNFKGIKGVFRKDYNGLYKYFSGSYKSYEEAQKERQKIIKKFPDAFIVAFKNEELISVKMALED